MRLRHLAIVVTGYVLVSATVGWACDPCALYSASRLQGHSDGAVTLSVSEQYTAFDKSDSVPENSIRNGELVRGFSTTQVALSYDLAERGGLQLTLPIIVRSFDTIERYRADSDSDADFGDLSFVGNYTFFDARTDRISIIAGVTAGVKFPTGDSGILREVVQEDNQHQESDLARPFHHVVGASGGRALTFGTGSYDYIFGLNLLARYERFLALSYAQYTVRTEGDFEYEFADDLVWSVGAGSYLLLDDRFSTAVLIALSGEYKGNDHHGGELVDSSAVSNLYLGPALLITLGNSWGFEVGADFRVTDEDESTTVVPGWRLRSSLSYRFN